MRQREQLSLFVPRAFTSVLDGVRRIVDPVQSRLIPAHVTLCREDELAGLEPALLRTRLQHCPHPALELEFSPPQVFEGHGILMACSGGEAQFRALREWILGTARIRRQAPHLTLAHPRNPRAAGNCLENTAILKTPLRIVLDRIQHIAQTADQPWLTLASFPLGVAPAPSAMG